MASMISTIRPGFRSPPAMTDPASTLVQTVGMLEIRPSRSSVDRRGIRTAVAAFIRPIPLRRTISRARCDRLPLRLHRWQAGLQGSEKLRGYALAILGV